jgi:Poly(ADP-ribose) polymerase catalytic domain/Poly(ADP-ribose) polymerase, regulatory domain
LPVEEETPKEGARRAIKPAKSAPKNRKSEKNRKMPSCAKCGGALVSLPPPKFGERGYGWACDQREEKGGCARGCTGFQQSTGWGRYRCEACDYDLCDRCFERAERKENPVSESRPSLGLRAGMSLSRVARPPKSGSSGTGNKGGVQNPTLFRGCVFALAGAQWQTTNLVARLIFAHGGKLSKSEHAADVDLMTLLMNSGGRDTSEEKEVDLEGLGYGVDVSADVTHVLSSDEMAGVYGNSYKAQFFPTFGNQIEQAEILSIPVVSGRWMEASVRAGKLLSTAPYLIFGHNETDVNLESKLEPRVQELVGHLFDESAQQHAMLSMDLDSSRIANVTEDSIRRAYTLLSDMGDAIALKSVKSSQAKATEDLQRLSREFYRLIPHTSERSVESDSQVKAKLSMLSALSDIVVAQSMMRDASLRGSYSMSPIDMNYQKLKTKITPLEHWTAEYEIIETCVNKTRAKVHDYFESEVKHIFEVERDGEAERYAPFEKLKHRRLLWHGSRTSNWIGILSQGLRIAPPEAPVTGYFLGKGVYFADMASKSVEYCAPTPENPYALMALCEVALGRPFQIAHTKFITKEDLDEAHFHSVKGCGELGPDPAFNKELDDGTIIALGPEAEMGVLRSELSHSEFVVYDTSQIRIKYLVLLKVASDRDVKAKSLVNAN